MSETRSTPASLQGKVGQELGVSGWVKLTQQKFDTFAEVTGDRDWMHNDPQRAAKESPFGTTIAQGHLLLSHLSQFGEELMPRPAELAYALNYGYDRVRVVRPVPVNSRIRGRMVLKEIRPKGDGAYVLKNEVSIEVEGSDEPAVVAEWLAFAKLK